MSLAEFEGDNPMTLLQGMQKYADATFEEIATATKFLPRLQLFSSNSGEVKEEKIRQGHYGLLTMKGQPVIDLSESIDVLICVWRPKALDMTSENVISCFNVEDPLFKEIAEKSEDADSGCMFGPEFLVWIPSVKKFATFFCGSKTARRESVNIKSLCGHRATLKSNFIKKGRYSWHGPRVIECSTPFDMPEPDDLREKVEDFNNPLSQQVEKIDPSLETGRAR